MYCQGSAKPEDASRHLSGEALLEFVLTDVDLNMDLKYQECGSCGYQSMRNVLETEVGNKVQLYISCAQCHEFIARFTVNRCYHHGEGIDSYLTSLPEEEFDSGHAFLESLAALRRDAVDGFERVSDALDTKLQ